MTVGAKTDPVAATPAMTGETGCTAAAPDTPERRVWCAVAARGRELLSQARKK